MGTRIKCKKCNDIIEGDRQGTFISCKCKATYIDETPDYCRIGGNPEDILFIKEDGSETPMIEQQPAPKRIDKINYYLDIAESASKRSTCLKRHYGAIIVKNDETEYYCRVGGDPKYISWVSDTGEETPVLLEVKEETPKYERPSKENYYL